MSKVKKKRSFGKGLLIYVIVMLVIIAVGLGLFWRYIYAYEQARPEGAVENYIQTDLPEELADAITTYGEEHATAYESAEDIAGVIAKAIEGGEMSYRKTPGAYTQEAPVYTLRCDKKEIATMELRSVDAGFLRFGFDTWERSKTEYQFDAFAVACTITAPAGTEVLVNGRVLTEDYRTGDGAYAELKAYADEIPVMPETVTYEIGLFGEAKITARNEFNNSFLVETDETGTVSIRMVCPVDLEDELLDYAAGFVKEYVAFTSHAVEEAGIVQSYMISGSELYERMNAALDGLSWVHGVTGTMHDLTVGNLSYYGGVAVCEAHYGLSSSAGDTENNIRIVLTETDNGWRVATMEMF